MILRLLYRFWLKLSMRRKTQLVFLLLIMLIASFAEIVSIGAVLPFLAVLTTPERIFGHPAAQTVIGIFAITTPGQLLLPVSILFAIAATMSGVVRLLLLWASTRISYSIGADLSIDIYRRTLYQPYSVHVARNSSEIINGISGKTGTVIAACIGVLNLISAVVILTAILIALISLEPVVAVGSFLGFGGIYGTIIMLTRGTLKRNSQRIAEESTQVIKSLQEGLGGIRDVLIDGTQATYCKAYQNADHPLRRAQGNNYFISLSPRYALEALGMVLISAIAYFLVRQPDGIAKTIPVLGALALGAQRLLPVLQLVYSSWINLLGNQSSLEDALHLLDQPLPEYVHNPSDKTISFEKQIVLRNLFFRYSDQAPYVLKDVNLVIRKGSRIGFVGATGSGKSTLLDLIMGLLMPTQGAFEVDGQPIDETNVRAWQVHIAHVPQFIFLSDSTIAENIAFGIPKHKIDHARVRYAAAQAQISGIIEEWPHQYQTRVGERGVRLSGGQRQRIGIARALYKQADVIVFDEATSALDNETELAVMQSIEKLSENLTILIIAHRLTTLRACTVVVELANENIKRKGSYQEIVADGANIDQNHHSLQTNAS